MSETNLDSVFNSESTPTPKDVMNYLDGKMSAEEAKVFEKQIESSEFTSEGMEGLSEVSTSAALQSRLERINRKVDTQIGGGSGNSFSGKGFWWIAASVIATIGVGYLVLRNQPKENPRMAHSLTTESKKIERKEVRNEPGGREMKLAQKESLTKEIPKKETVVKAVRVTSPERSQAILELKQALQASKVALSRLKEVADHKSYPDQEINALNPDEVIASRDRFASQRAKANETALALKLQALDAIPLAQNEYNKAYDNLSDELETDIKVQTISKKQLSGNYYYTKKNGKPTKPQKAKSARQLNKGGRSNKQDPTHPETANLNLMETGITQTGNGSFGKALTEFEKVPVNSEFYLSAVWYRAICKTQLSNFQEAKALFNIIALSNSEYKDEAASLIKLFDQQLR